MQFPLVFNILGFLYLFLSLTMILPLAVAFIYGDGCSLAFIYSIITTAIFGCILYWIFPHKKRNFLIVTASQSLPWDGQW